MLLLLLLPHLKSKSILIRVELNFKKGLPVQVGTVVVVGLAAQVGTVAAEQAAQAEIVGPAVQAGTVGLVAQAEE